MTNVSYSKIERTNGKRVAPFAVGTSIIGLLGFPDVAHASSGDANILLGGLGLCLVLTTMVMIKRLEWGLLLASLIGVVLSAYLGLQHNALSGDSICSISSAFDCDVVNRSKWSEIWGYPIAFLGTAFYAAVAMVVAQTLRKPEAHQLAGHLVRLAGGLSVLYAIFLAYISSVEVGAWCLFCIGMYTVNVLIAVGGFMWVQRIDGGLKAAILGKSDASISTMASTFVAVLLLGGLMGTGGSSPNSPASTKAAGGAWPLSSLSTPLTLDGSEPVYGSATASYLVVEFADYECPFCGDVAPRLKALLDEHPEVRMMFKHYPISSLCNENVEGERHANACAAAVATDCAQKQGKFWEMNNLVFKNQQFLSPGDIGFLAQQVGLEKDSFQACINDPGMLEGVRADVAHASAVNVSGTPSLYFQGHDGKKWARIDGTVEALETILTRLAAGEKPPLSLP